MEEAKGGKSRLKYGFSNDHVIFTHDELMNYHNLYQVFGYSLESKKHQKRYIWGILSEKVHNIAIWVGGYIGITGRK